MKVAAPEMDGVKAYELFTQITDTLDDSSKTYVLHHGMYLIEHDRRNEQMYYKVRQEDKSYTRQMRWSRDVKLPITEVDIQQLMEETADKRFMYVQAAQSLYDVFFKGMEGISLAFHRAYVTGVYPTDPVYKDKKARQHIQSISLVINKGADQLEKLELTQYTFGEDEHILFAEAWIKVSEFYQDLLIERQAQASFGA